MQTGTMTKMKAGRSAKESGQQRERMDQRQHNVKKVIVLAAWNKKRHGIEYNNSQQSPKSQIDASSEHAWMNQEF